MSFGFGDFIAGIRLCSDIVTACSEISGAPQAHKDFFDVASALRASLESLVDVIKARNSEAKTERFKHQNDETTWASLKEVTLDFRVTLETIQLRLQQYPINTSTGLGGRIMYWYNAKEEIQELLDRCRYHIITINFILEPFKIKIMEDIRQSIKEMHGDVKDIQGRVINMETLIETNFDDLRDMLSNFNHTTELIPQKTFDKPPRRPTVPAPLDLGISSADGLDEKFRRQMQDDSENSMLELRNISLAELTGSATWWLRKIQASVEDASVRRTLTPLQYLYLRKSVWIIGGFVNHPELQNLSDKKSLWHLCCQKLKEEVDQVFTVMRNKDLQIPVIESLIGSLEPCDFSPLVELEHGTDNTTENFDEELILKLQLPAVSHQASVKFLVFRQGSGHLRCVGISNSTRSRGRVVREMIKEYTINPVEWSLRPLYMFRPKETCLNLILYKQSETKSFTFSNHKDLLAFQHAFTAGQVSYVSSHFKKIRYQEPGLMRGHREFSTGLLQIWYEKPRARLDPEGNTPSTEASLSPTTTARSVAWSTAPSIAFSTTTTHRQPNSAVTLLSMEPVETSRLFACLIGNGTKQFVTFTLSNKIGFSNTSCCSNFHLHPRGGAARQVPKEVSEICCPKLVIETVTQGGTFLAQVLESTKEEDTFGMTLDEKRLPKGSKTIKLSDFTVLFESETEKLRFITEYHKLEKIRALKELSNRETVAELRRGERRGEVPQTEDFPQQPRRSSTFSLGFSSRFLRRGSNVS